MTDSHRCSAYSPTTAKGGSARIRAGSVLLCVLCLFPLSPLRSASPEHTREAAGFDIRISCKNPDLPIFRDRPGFRISDAGPGYIRATASGEALRALKRAGISFRTVARTAQRASDGYLDYPDILNLAHQWEQQFPDLCRVDSIGQSVQGRTLIDIVVSRHPGIREFEPQIKFVASMHGDEPAAGYLCLRLVRYLLCNADTDESVRALVDSIELHVLPVMNPDGYSATPRTRWNAAGVDLNRNFPSVADPVNTPAGRAPETAAVMAWTDANRFCTSISFHTGSLGAVYPWGHAANLGPDEINPETPLFRNLCFTYTAGNPDMWDRNSNGWEHGVRNAADWYPVLGEMADWNYRWYGVLELTVELSYQKAPPAPPLDAPWDLWDRNREAMLGFLRRSTGGVRGYVFDVEGDAVPARLAPGRMPREGGRRQTAPVRALCFLHLDPGWNLVAIPLHPDVPAIATLFQAPLTTGWRWTGQGYARAEQIEPYEPLWIFSTVPQDVKLSGTAAEADGPVRLHAGWNLVASRDYLPLPAETGDGSPVSAWAWAREASRYTLLEPGTTISPTQGIWVFAERETTIDLSPGPNRPFPSRNEDDSGAFFRTLLPGVCSFWFQDRRQPALHHTQPSSPVPSGQPVEIVATADVPCQPLEVFGVRVPSWDDRTAPAPYTALTVWLRRLPAECRIHFSTDGGATWTDTAMEQRGENTFAHPFAGLASGQEVRYWFSLFTDESGNPAATLGDAFDPFVLTAGSTRERSLVGQPLSLPASLGPGSNPRPGRTVELHAPPGWHSWSGTILTHEHRSATTGLDPVER